MRSVPKPEDRGKRLSSIDGQPPSLLNLPPGAHSLARCPETLRSLPSPEFPPEVNVAEPSRRASAVIARGAGSMSEPLLVVYRLKKHFPVRGRCSSAAGRSKRSTM